MVQHPTDQAPSSSSQLTDSCSAPACIEEAIKISSQVNETSSGWDLKKFEFKKAIILEGENPTKGVKNCEKIETVKVRKNQVSKPEEHMKAKVINKAKIVKSDAIWKVTPKKSRGGSKNDAKVKKKFKKMSKA